MVTEQAAGQRPLVLFPDGVSEAGQSKAAGRAGCAGSGAAVASAQSWRCALPLSPWEAVEDTLLPMLPGLTPLGVWSWPETPLQWHKTFEITREHQIYISIILKVSLY